MSCPVVPAFIPNSKEEVAAYTKQLHFVHEIQLDVVDGVLVSQKSWPYTNGDKPISIKAYTDPFTLEVDLMVAEPFLAARDWIAAGADMLVFHIESMSLSAFKNFIEHCPITVGVSMHGDTTIEQMLPFAAEADYIQLMGIHTIGAQGQPFDESVLEKIKVLKSAYPEKLISIDGSVNEQTIKKLKDAGAARFVSGSAIVGSENPEEAYKKLCESVNG